MQLKQIQSRTFLSSIAVLIAITVAQSTLVAQEGAMDLSKNPLIAEWTGPYGGVPPWKSIDSEDFVKAHDKAIEMAKADIDAIANQTEAPTFANTMVAMENAGKTLTRLQSMFGVHTSNLNLGGIGDMEAKIAPMMSKYGDWVTQHEGLFSRIEAVYNSDELKSASVAQKRLVDDSYKTFVRRGAKLGADEKSKLSGINTELASLFTRFSQNVLGDEGKLFTKVEPGQIGGLPQSVVDGMAANAKTREMEGYVVNNTRSSMEPVLTYADDRSLR